MMMFTLNHVRPWFNGLPSDFSDAPSYRHMIAAVERESAEIRRYMPDYERAGFADIVAECNADLEIADDMLAKMRVGLVTAEASGLDNLDDAVAKVQEAIGVKAGDYASVFFNDRHMARWADEPRDWRVRLLRTYVQFEKDMAS